MLKYRGAKAIACLEKNRHQQRVRQHRCRSKKDNMPVESTLSVTNDEDCTTEDCTTPITTTQAPVNENPRFTSMGVDKSDLKQLGMKLLEAPHLQCTPDTPVISPLRSYPRVNKTSSEVSRKLPLDKHKQASTLAKMFLRVDRATNGLGVRYLMADKKGQKLVDQMVNDQHNSTTRRKLQCEIRQISIYRSKKNYGKVKAIAEKLCSQYKIADMARISNRSYSSMRHVLTLPRKNKHLKGRNITVEQKETAIAFFMSNLVSMKLPYKRTAKNRYLRMSRDAAWEEYARFMNQEGQRVLSMTAIRDLLPKTLKCNKQIRYQQCLCYKCLNFGKKKSALRAINLLGIHQRMTHCVFNTMCPAIHYKEMETFISQKEKDKKTGRKRKRKEVQPHEDFEIRKKERTGGGSTQEEVQKKSTKRPVKRRKLQLTPEQRKFAENLKQEIALTKNPDVTNGDVTDVDEMCHLIYDFDRRCIFRKCKKCTKQVSYEDLLQQNPAQDWSKEVRFFQWESHSKIVNGKSKRTEYVEVEHFVDVSTLLQMYLKEAMQMSTHIFHWNWQAYQFEYAKEYLARGDILQVMDFAQNTEHRAQDEPQSAHWYRVSSTLHPVVCYYRCPQASCRAIVTDEILVISKDKKHDAQAVEVFMREANDELVKQHIPINRFIQFTDNCAAQYKCAAAFEMLSRWDKPIQRNYFGAQHGKGPGDSCIGRVVQAADRAVRGRQVVISDGLGFYFFCAEYLATTDDPSMCCHFRQHFRYVHQIERSQIEVTAAPLKRTQTIHCVRNTGVHGIVQHRESSCFCRFVVLLVNGLHP